jgi:hypothetical protein
MTTFPNAPAPRSALFDDAPAATTAAIVTTDANSITAAAVPQTLTVHLTPATRIAQGRNGKWYSLDVLMQYGAPVPVDLAIKRVAIGRTVFVQPGDAGAVLEAVGGTDGEGS